MAEQAALELQGSSVSNTGEVESSNGNVIGNSKEGAQKRDPQAWSHLPVAKAHVGQQWTHSHGGREYTLTCISTSPATFRVSGLLESEECISIVDRARPLLEHSYVTGGKGSSKIQHGADKSPNNNKGEDGTGEGERAAGGVDVDSLVGYRSSENAWLPPDDLLRDVRLRLEGLLGVSEGVLARHAEELQVIRYEGGGQFKVHHDSSAFMPRALTVLIYLNEVAEGGGTWFPYVGVNSVDREGVTSVEDANSRALGATPADSTDSTDSTDIELKGKETGFGMTQKPKKGDALLFFNHDPLGVLDKFAAHAGLPVLGQGGADGMDVEKWAANFWFSSLQ